MKRYIFSVLGGLVITIIGLVIYISNNIEKPCLQCLKSKNSKPSELKISDMFIAEPDLCKILTGQKISELLGKPVIKIKSVATGKTHSCQYYLTQNDAAIVNHDYENIREQKKATEYLGIITRTDPQIPMEHFIVYENNGNINKIVLVMNDNEYVSVNRTSSKNITESEIIDLAVKLSNILSDASPRSKIDLMDTPTNIHVPLPQAEDIIRNFINLINENRPSDAVSMMSRTHTIDESEKQAWAVQFNAIDSMIIETIELSQTNTWTDSEQIYKMVLTVKMNPNSAFAQIPYYGWNDGKNIKWITVIKEDNLWKIKEISSGP
jgi:hypothetical protein